MTVISNSFFQTFSNQNTVPTPGAGSSFPAAGPNKGMPPPIQQPRRHPDFSKESQQSSPPNSYPTYSNQQQQQQQQQPQPQQQQQQQQRPMFAGMYSA